MNRQKVQVWLHRQSPGSGEFEVLLLQTTAERGALWQPVTGWAETHESLEDAATREAEEETGWTLESRPIPLELQFSFEGRWGPATESVFAVSVSSLSTPPTLDPSEHVAWRWTPATQALGLLPHDSQKKALARVIERFS